MSLAACLHIVGVHNCIPTHSRLTFHEFHTAVRSHVIIMLAFSHTSVTWLAFSYLLLSVSVSFSSICPWKMLPLKPCKAKTSSCKFGRDWGFRIWAATQLSENPQFLRTIIYWASLLSEWDQCCPLSKENIFLFQTGQGIYRCSRDSGVLAQSATCTSALSMADPGRSVWFRRLLKGTLQELSTIRWQTGGHTVTEDSSFPRTMSRKGGLQGERVQGCA